MNRTDSRWNDTRVIAGSDNIFVDLGFSPEQAEVMKLRALVMIEIEQYLKAQGWTQAEAARRLKITQPRVCRLLKGKWEDFSLDMLLTLAARVGLKPRLQLAAQDPERIAPHGLRDCARNDNPCTLSPPPRGEEPGVRGNAARCEGRCGQGRGAWGKEKQVC